MRDTTILMDPTSEQELPRRTRLTPPESLAGLTIGLLDISKPRGDVFLDRIQSRLTESGFAAKRYRKPTIAKKAPPETIDAIVDECDVVVEALAD